jgi:hypothetical protein
MAREQNFVTDRSQLVQVVIPARTNINSNQIKLFFSTTQTNALYGRLINRIRFFGIENAQTGFDLQRINGTAIYAPFGNTVIYFTLKDSNNNILIDSANLYDFAQQCNNVDGAGRKIYAPIRRLAQVVDWQKSYLTLCTVTPVTTAVDAVIGMYVSYTYPVKN